jgi:hypothetical protein
VDIIKVDLYAHREFGCELGWVSGKFPVNMLGKAFGKENFETKRRIVINEHNSKSDKHLTTFS